RRRARGWLCRGTPSPQKGGSRLERWRLFALPMRGGVWLLLFQTFRGYLSNTKLATPRLADANQQRQGYFFFAGLSGMTAMASTSSRQSSRNRAATPTSVLAGGFVVFTYLLRTCRNVASDSGLNPFTY